MMSEACNTAGTRGIKEIPASLYNQLKSDAEYLDNFQDVSTIGPGGGPLWVTPDFDEPANKLMDIVRSTCKRATFYSGLPVMRTMV